MKKITIKKIKPGLKQKIFSLKTSSQKGVSVIILVFSLLSILALSALVLDMGLILNQRYELQKATESAALQTISEYELYETDRASIGDFRLRLPNNDSAPYDDSKMENNADIYYKALKDYNQLLSIGTSSTPTVTFNNDSRAILLETVATVPTYFMSLLGIREVEIEAKAAAVNSPVYLSKIFPRPNGSIITGVAAGYQDTEIRPPVGWDTSTAVHPTGTVYNQNSDIDNIFGRPDGKVLSLGPGGHILINLPATIFDGKGVDFVIYERGNAEGYFVYAGIDADPTNPYINAANPGGGINWVNISCTGIPLYGRMDDDEMLGAHRTQVRALGVDYDVYKFYGSGLFDIGARCDNAIDGIIYDGTDPLNSFQVKNIKYLKIIDDNIEDGFFLTPQIHFTNHPAVSFYPTDTEYGIPMVIPGEHSSITPGVDIDAVGIMHHSRLIGVSDFSTDTDGDRLIDVVENINGFDPSNSDTDGDGIDDFLEFEGFEPDTAVNYLDSPQSETVQDDLQTLYMGYPEETFVPPNIIIEP